MEEWRDIEGYEGLYQVSNLGRVKSLNYRRTRKEKLLSARKHTDGHLFISLYKNGKEKTTKYIFLLQKRLFLILKINLFVIT